MAIDKKVFAKFSVPGLEEIRTGIVGWFRDHFAKISADTLGWVATILIHCATIPTLVAVSAGLTDRMPPVDMVLFGWGALMLLLARAAILRDVLNMVTIGIGFAIQATMMALLLFK
jgi:hypothetical protein